MSARAGVVANDVTVKIHFFLAHLSAYIYKVKSSSRLYDRLVVTENVGARRINEHGKTYCIIESQIQISFCRRARFGGSVL